MLEKHFGIPISHWIQVDLDSVTTLLPLEEKPWALPPPQFHPLSQQSHNSPQATENFLPAARCCIGQATVVVQTHPQAGRESRSGKDQNDAQLASACPSEGLPS